MHLGLLNYKYYCVEMSFSGPYNANEFFVRGQGIFSL